MLAYFKINKCFVYIQFHSMNTAHIRPTKPIAQPPTDRVTGIDVIPNKSSGSKAIEACAKYSKMATVFFPSSIINGRPAQVITFYYDVYLSIQSILMRFFKLLNKVD